MVPLKVLICGKKRSYLVYTIFVWQNLDDLSFFLSFTLFKLLSVAWLVEELHIATFNNRHSLRYETLWLWTVCGKSMDGSIFCFLQQASLCFFLSEVFLWFFFSSCIICVYLSYLWIEVGKMVIFIWDDYPSNWSVWHPS